MSQATAKGGLIVGYVIREGLEKGKGRYVGKEGSGPDWQAERRAAVVWMAKEYAEDWGEDFLSIPYRVVRIVRRKKHVVEVRQSLSGDHYRVFVNGILIIDYCKDFYAQYKAAELRRAIASPITTPSPLPADAADEAIVDALKAKRDAKCQSRPMRTDAAAIRADERERCAKECDRLAALERDAKCTGAANSYEHAAHCIRGLR